MEHVKKYNISWSDLRGKALAAEIWQRGWVGGVTAVKTTDIVCEISHPPDGNLLSPIKTSTANLRLYSESDFQWQEFHVTTVGEYFLRLIQDGNTIWEGMIVDSVYTEPYVDVPYGVNLRFSCGLSELKSIDYLDGSGNFIIGHENLLTIIQRCLNKLPYNLRLKELINVYNDNMNTARTTLQETYIDNLIFIDIDGAGKMKARKCQFVIKEIMKTIGCRIFQSSNDPDAGPEINGGGSPENVWWVQRVEELSDEASLSLLNFREFLSNGTSYAWGKLPSLDKTITNTETGIKFLHSDAELEIIPAIKTIKYKRKLAYEWAIRNNLVFDENFKFWIQNTDTGLSESFESYKPRYWFLSPDLQALTNFNDKNTEILDDDYIQKLSADGGVRWGNNLMNEYEDFNSLFYMEAQFFEININPYAPPSNRSTREKIQINTSDKLTLFYDVDFHLSIIPTWDLLPGLNVELVFQIILINIATSDKYFLRGLINPDGSENVPLRWDTVASGSDLENFRLRKICNKGIINFSGTLTTPDFPFTGQAKLTFRVAAPVKNIVSFNNGAVIVSVTKIDFKECDLRIKSIKNVLSDIEDNIYLQDSDLIRDNDYQITNIIGDGPSQDAISSFRYKVSATNFPITDKWTRLNAPSTPTFTAKDIFLIDVLKNFLSNQKTMISGTLYGLTDFNFQNVIISDKSVRYIMDGMTWNLKTGEKQVELLELTTGVGLWGKSSQLAEGVVMVGPESESPLTTTPTPGDVLDTGTVVIGGAAGTGTGTSGTDEEVADISNYPIQP